MAKKKRVHRHNPAFDGCDEGQSRSPSLVFVHVDANDNTWFSALLTRVPCVGEEVTCEADTFKVVRVIHQSVNAKGQSACGLHALLDVELMPQE
jgi:hypothetical protein